MRPFRAEHIGSLLRPAALLAARREFDGGSLSAQALRDAEDRFIRDAVALQERVGLEVITDGEYRRVIYFGHFPAAVSGFTEMDAEITFQDARAGAMVGRYVSLVNDALRDRPAGMTVGIHLCRGNNQGKWIGEGGYDAVAERIFTGLAVDAFFLEYDSPRAGSFAPLRLMPRDRHVVLGLVTSKTPALESADALAKRIDEASRLIDVARLSLSPQCGFASTAPGNPLTPADQEAKLRLVEIGRAHV